MVSHLLYYQLALLALIWLFVMLPLSWPRRSEPPPPVPATPIKPKRQRSTEPQAFEGLTHKPPCALCEREAGANRAMTLFTPLGPSADCSRLTQVPTYQVRTGPARGAAFSVSPRGFSLGWGLQGKVTRTPHQSKGSGGTVCRRDSSSAPATHLSSQSKALEAS
jgi:hypothetical protein